MKDNKFPAVFGGLMAVGVLGFGYFAFSSWSSLKKATTDYKNTSRMVTDLRQSKLFPDENNLAAKIEQVDAYEASVDALQKKLVGSQRALKAVQQQDFPKILLSAYEQTAAAAAAAAVSLPENFYFGMEVYKNGLPPAVACPLLEWELDGISFLTNILIDEGVKSLDSITRELMPVESPDYDADTAGRDAGNNGNAPAGAGASGDEVAYEPERVMDTYRFTIEVTADHGAWEKVLNRIANEKSFFYWTRFMRVENAKKEGPAKGLPFTPEAVPDELDTAAAVPEEVVPAPVDPDADPEAVAIPDANAFGAELKAPAMIDVQEILGTEKVRALLVIDLVRFKDMDAPAEGDAPTPAEGDAAAPAN